MNPEAVVARHLAVFVTTERLRPHDVAEVGKETFAFGVNIQTAMACAPNEFDFDTDRHLLEPWRKKTDAGQFGWQPVSWVMLWGRVQPGDPWKQLCANPVKVTDHPDRLKLGVDAYQALVKSLEIRANELYGSAKRVQPFLWDPTNPTAEAPPGGFHRQLLGYAATLPPPAAHSLNLAMCVFANLADVDGDFLKGKQFKDNVEVIAVPHFTCKPEKAEVAYTSEDKPVELPGFETVWAAPYKRDKDGTDAVAYAVPCPAVEPNVAGRFFDLTSFWVRKSSGSGDFATPADDWLAQFADRAADAFDLARRLIGAAKAVFNATKDDKDRTAYWQALLACLRDKADPGWRDGPDGAGLVRYAAERVLARARDPRAETAPTLWRAFVEGWLRALIEQLRDATRYESLDEWRKRLIDLIPEVESANPPLEPPADGSPDKTTYLTPLVRAAGQLDDDSVLARVIGREWDEGARKRGLLLPPKTRSRHYFTAVRPDLAGIDPKNPGGAKWSAFGTLNLQDGATWVITLPMIQFLTGDEANQPPAPGQLPRPGIKWQDTAKYAIDLFELPASPKGESSIRLEVEHKAAGAADATLRMKIEGREVAVKVEITVPTDGPSCYYHLRLTAVRSGDVFRAGVTYGRFEDYAEAKWINPILVVEAKSQSAFSRVAVTIDNNLGGAALVLSSDRPSVLAAREATAAEREATVKAWDEQSRLDKALTFWESSGSAMVALLPEVQIRRRLALGFLGPVWPILVYQQQSSTDEPGELRKRFAGLLKYAPLQRLDLATDAAPRRAESPYLDEVPLPSKPLSDDARKALRDAVAQFADAEAKQLVPPAPATDDLTPDETAPPLFMQVDRVGQFAGLTTTGGDDDLLRRVAGVGVLIRQPKNAPDKLSFKDEEWRCLNMTALNARTTGDGESKYDPVLDFAVAPVRIVYREGARQAVLNYNNHPLVAESPAAKFAALKEFRDEYDYSSAAGVAAAYRYPAVKPPGEKPDKYNWAKLASLKFGQFYQVLVYLIGNSGTLPKELANGHPAKIRDERLIPGAPDEFKKVGKPTTPIEESLRSVRYLRRVRVGLPRVAPVNNRSPLPVMPTDVFPLARELGLQALTENHRTAWFFADKVSGSGTLPGAVNWVIVVPRVTPAVRQIDANNNDPTDAAKWTFLAEVRTRDNTVVSAKFERNEDWLTANVNGKKTTVDLGEKCEPIDLRLVGRNGKLTFGWRASDRALDWQAPKQDEADTGPIQGTAIVVRLPDDARSPVPLTFGPIGFAVFDTKEREPQPAPSPDPPLVVLAHDTGPKTLTFSVRPPAADLQTWDRWVAMDEWLDGNGDPCFGKTAAEIKLKRTRVWGDYHSLLLPDEKTKPDVSLDDPAVRWLVIELVPLLVEADMNPPDSDVVALPVELSGEAKDKPQISFVQSGGIAFEVFVQPRSTKLDAKRIVVKDGRVTITVREQELWELRVYPAIAAKWFAKNDTQPGSQRFPSAFKDVELSSLTAITVKTRDGKEEKIDVRLFAPWRLIIEAATRAVLLPKVGKDKNPVMFPEEPPLTDDKLRERIHQAAQKQLFENLTPSFDGRNVLVRLEKLSPRAYRYVALVRLLRQVWRWRGRPVPPFPFRQALGDPNSEPFNGALEELNRWDAVGFGDRTATDLLQEARAVGCPDYRPELFREDVGSVRRALYYRFAVRAISRYAGMYRANPPDVLSFLATTKPPATPSEGTTWKRLAVPCRDVAPPPRPVVRLVVPLTQPEVPPLACGSPPPRYSPAPGFVVVTEGPFFDHGLVEVLDGEVAWVKDPKTDYDRPQYGPDSTRTKDGFTISEEDPKPPKVALPLTLLGPIGHTFDTDAEAPFYNAASFVLRPPPALERFPDLGGFFAKIRFRRLLLPEGMAEYPLTGTLAKVTDEARDFATPIAPEGNWAITVADVDMGNARTLTAELTFPVDPATTTTRKLTVNYEATEALAFEWDSPAGTRSFLGAGPAFDLRFIFQVEVPEEPPNEKDPPPRHVTVSVRLSASRPNSDEAGWQLIQTVALPAGRGWPEKLALRTGGAGQVVNLSQPVVAPARVSAFTPAAWVQLLDNARDLVKHAQPDTLTWLKDKNAIQLMRDGNPQHWELKPITNQDGGSRYITYRLLLTELIQDVRGQTGHERYIGLFSQSKDDLTTFLQAHASPLIPLEDAKQIRFPRVRILELEWCAAPDTPGTSVGQGWADVFGPFDVSDLDRLEDVRARIVRVSPAIDLKTKTDTTPEARP